jgi:HTH-type transcriptional regulator/antitoxin HigA
MATRTTPRTAPDTYFEQIKRFPLAHIRDDHHLKGALKVIELLLREDLDAGEQMYLDALTDLVETYEAEHYPMPDAPEADVLRELMAANRLSQPALAKVVGIAQSTLSAVLNGQRTLTKTHVIALAKHFGVSPAVFLPG